MSIKNSNDTMWSQTRELPILTVDKPLFSDYKLCETFLVMSSGSLIHFDRSFALEIFL